MNPKRAVLLDAAAIFLLAVALIWPLFQATYLDRWESIESTFIADARFLNAHWPHPGWQPLWYTGTRFDYVYPPALRYGTALAARIFGVPEARGYHLYTAFFYCLGIAGVYVFVRVLSGSRGLAWMAALGAAVLSPSFLFMANLRGNAGYWLAPQRLGVLIRYGEGPHITALSLIPWALAACYAGFERSRLPMLGAAGALVALVVSNNFYGATALAVLLPILVWSVWVTHRDPWIWGRAAAVVGIAYGLTAFWLVPSYLRLTLFNMQFVAREGQSWSTWVLAAAAAAFAYVSHKVVRGKPGSAYRVFVWGAAGLLSLIVLGWHFWNFRIIGEPIRLVPELDLALTLAALEGLRWLWTNRRPALRLAAVVLVLAALVPSRKYVRHAWQIMTPDAHPERRVEYQITDWMAKNLPDSRAVATGSIRFWYDAWHDLPQLGGGSEQGLLNPVVMPAQWELVLGPDAGPGIAWMQAMGVDAVIVPGERSSEIYHDWKYPRKFAGALAVIHDSGKGETIYRVPRRFLWRARVVETKRITGLRTPAGSTDFNAVNAYVDAIEKGPAEPARVERLGTDAMRIRARVGEGQAVLVQESYDPAWVASSAGTVVEIRKDPMGFMLLNAPPGEHEIRLEFHMPLENIAGWFITAWTVIAMAGMWVYHKRRKPVAF